MIKKSSAHLKTLREACGLSQREAAEFCGGISIRTWKFWEATDTELAIKPDILEQLEDLFEWQQDRIDFAVEVIEEATVPVTLTRYRSQQLLDMHHPGYRGGLASHTNVVLNVFRDVQLLGIDITIVWDGDGPSGTDFQVFQQNKP